MAERTEETYTIEDFEQKAQELINLMLDLCEERLQSMRAVLREVCDCRRGRVDAAGDGRPDRLAAHVELVPDLLATDARNVADAEHFDRLGVA